MDQLSEIAGGPRGAASNNGRAATAGCVGSHTDSHRDGAGNSSDDGVKLSVGLWLKRLQ